MCSAKCGYAYYGKTIRQLGAGRQMMDFVYYRCSGSDSYRFGERICNNLQVQGAFLETTVWRKVSSLLMNPERIEMEYQETSMAGTLLGNLEVLRSQRTKLQHAGERLIDQLHRGLNRKRTIYITDGSNQTPHRRSRRKDHGECNRC